MTSVKGSVRIRESKKDQRRLALIAAGMQLFVEQSFAKTTIDQITGKAGFAKGTFYNYFTTKEDLLVSALQLTQDQDLEQTRRFVMEAGTVVERLQRVSDCALVWNVQYPELGMIWLGERLRRGLAQTRSGFDQLIAEVITEGQAAGALRSDRSAEAMVLEVEGILLAYVAAWLHNQEGMDLTPAVHEALAGYVTGAQNA